MNRATAITSTVLFPLLLCSCIGTPPKPLPPPNVKALTTPAPRPTKAITELRTEGDEQEYIVQAAAAMAKDESTFRRLREFLEGEPTFWQRIKNFFGGSPAGGGK